MQKNRLTAVLSSVIVAASVLAGCGSTESKPAPQAADTNAPFALSMGFQQVGDIPDNDNDVQKAIEKYTNTKLSIQWIPDANYDEKINVMIASNELPQMVKVKQTPSVIGALQSGQFWEIGPYLKDYKNLSAVNKIYYENIAVDGKIYGIPNFRDIGRAGIIYRKDWLDAMAMKVPATMDEWYTALKAMTLNDPDKNGKNDTFGTVLYKTFNGGTSSMLTRMAVSQGAPNQWAVDGGGKFTPSFTTAPYFDVLKLFRRLYAEKLINL
jgi:putative aldouronate transport system substrate-binding protein